MPQKRHRPEQIIAKLRNAGVLLRVHRSECEPGEPHGFTDTIDWSSPGGDAALMSGLDSTRSAARGSDYAFHC
jgi:hypothetical protein